MISNDTLSEEEMELMVHLVEKFQKPSTDCVISGSNYKVFKKISSPEITELSIQRQVIPIWCKVQNDSY